MSVAILDIDGTLVDTNYQHTISWARAFAAHDIVVSLWRIHRHIGMGGDQLVTAVCGDDVEARVGDEIRTAEADRYMELIDEVRPIKGARELILALKERGPAVVLASSAKDREVEHYLDLLDAREIADGWTTSADVEQTKPAPDLVHAALELVSDHSSAAVMVGDTPWDVRAAAKAGIDAITVMTGGFSGQELTGAGAVAVYESVADLGDDLDNTGLSGSV